MTALKRILKGRDGGEGIGDYGITDLARVAQEMERAAERFWRGGGLGPWMGMTPWPSLAAAVAPWPAIDVAEDEKALTIRADVPGLDAKDVTVELLGNDLTLRGSREEEKTEKAEGYSRHERQFGQFERTITLPSYVDPEKIEARYEKGTLTISVPKVAGAGPKKVAVQTA